MTALPHDFPGLMAEAHQLTDELLDGLGMEPCPRDALVRSCARLLADLTRRESRDRWAALMADRLGWEPDALTAPTFYFSPGHVETGHADYQPPGWWLMDDQGNGQFFTTDDSAAEEMDGTYVVGLPNDWSYGLEAFRVVLFAVFGVPL
jgi:hypothetical protein